MAITQEQADSASVFHQDATPWGTGRACDDPRGPIRWRRNGQTKRWKREPARFEVPVKHGLKSYDRIDAAALTDPYIHTGADCPVAPEGHN